MRRLDFYRFRDGITPLSEAELNARFFDIDARMHEIERLRISWEAALSELQTVVAERTAQLVPPLILAYEQGLEFLEAESARLRAEAAALVAAMTADRSVQQAALEALAAQFTGAVIRPNQMRGGSPGTITYTEGGSVDSISEVLPDGTYALAYGYGLNGNLETVTATLAGLPLWTRTYTYDAGGRLTDWTEA